MLNKRNSIDFDAGYYFRAIAFSVAIIISGVCIYFLVVEAKEGSPDYRKITGIAFFVVIIWGIFLLVRNVFNVDNKKDQVEDLFKSIREATKKARENAGEKAKI